MTSEITPEEIARVDEIHYWLDWWQEVLEPSACHYAIPTSPVRFTADEVRAWPRLKSEMIDRLRRKLAEVYSRATVRNTVTGGFSLEILTTWAPSEHARGLVMYRGSMAFLEATGQAAVAEAPKAVKISAATAKQFLDCAFETRRYCANDLSHEATIAARQDADDIASGRRARLVAALAKELDRPAPVRFPHEGRSDRVYQWRLR